MKTEKQIAKEMENEVSSKLENLRIYRGRVIDLMNDNLSTKLTFKSQEGLKDTLNNLDVEIRSLSELNNRFIEIKSK